MSRTPRTLQAAAAGFVIAKWAGFYLVVITFWPPAAEDTSQATVNRELAIIFAIPMLMWIAAALILLRFWWASSDERMSTMDAPARLLALVATALPERRREWGTAMAAELGEVPGQADRWRFALSCLAAAVALTVPRRRMRLSGSAIVVIAAVAASIALSAVLLTRDATLSPAGFAFLAAVLGACLWTALTARGDRSARIGVGVALAYAAGMELLIRLGYGLAVENRQEILILSFQWFLFGPAIACFFAATVSANASASVGSGLRAGMWTAITGLPAAYALWLAETFRLYSDNGGLLYFGDGAPPGENLSTALVWCLGVVPAAALPFIVLGAAFGRRLAR